MCVKASWRIAYSKVGSKSYGVNTYLKIASLNKLWIKQKHVKNAYKASMWKKYCDRDDQFDDEVGHQTNSSSIIPIVTRTEVSSYSNKDRNNLLRYNS